MPFILFNVYLQAAGTPLCLRLPDGPSGPVTGISPWKPTSPPPRGAIPTQLVHLVGNRAASGKPARVNSYNANEP